MVRAHDVLSADKRGLRIDFAVVWGLRDIHSCRGKLVKLGKSRRHLWNVKLGKVFLIVARKMDVVFACSFMREGLDGVAFELG